MGHFALVARLLPRLRAGNARVVSQVSIASNQGAINRDDPNWERGYHRMRAYSRSKIAFGLFGLELGRRSRAECWAITSALSHPGIGPTNLLAARTELGRARETAGRRVIRMLYRHRGQCRPLKVDGAHDVGVRLRPSRAVNDRAIGSPARGSDAGSRR